MMILPTLLFALSAASLIGDVMSTSGLEVITDENLVDLAKSEDYLIVLFSKQILYIGVGFATLPYMRSELEWKFRKNVISQIA